MARTGQVLSGFPRHLTGDLGLLVSATAGAAPSPIGLVPHIGFEPMISALRGRCPGPLDECGTDAGREPPRAGGHSSSDSALAATGYGPRRDVYRSTSDTSASMSIGLLR